MSVHSAAEIINDQTIHIDKLFMGTKGLFMLKYLLTMFLFKKRQFISSHGKIGKMLLHHALHPKIYIHSPLCCVCCGLKLISLHYSDVIMGAMASQIDSLKIVYSTVYSDADRRKHQSSASLASVRWIQMASNAENVSIWWRHHVSSIPQGYFTGTETIIRLPLSV